MTPAHAPPPVRPLRARLFTPLPHELWLPRLLYRLVAYAVIAGANLAGWLNVPWWPLAVLTALTVAGLVALGSLRPRPDGLAHALVPLPDVGVLYLILANAADPGPWVGLLYVWVAGLAFNTYARRTAALVPLWGALAYGALLASTPEGTAWNAWALGHGLCVALLTLVAYSYVRERTDLRLDGLTGVLERRFGLEALTALTYRDEPFQLAFVDLRDFKEVNDAYGHAVGDEVLAAIGGRLRGAVRQGDPVLRFGGDEFLVAGRQLDLAARLDAALAEPVRTSVGSLELVVDVGVDTWRPGDSLEGLVRQADARMYDHKRRVRTTGSGSDPR